MSARAGDWETRRMGDKETSRAAAIFRTRVGRFEVACIVQVSNTLACCRHPGPLPEGEGGKPVLQCKRPCSVVRAKRAVRGGRGSLRVLLAGEASAANFLGVRCQVSGVRCSLLVLVTVAVLILDGFLCLLRFDHGFRFAAEHVQP